MAHPDRRVLSRFGDYAALFDARFPGMAHPVLALKVEEPGSKQLLAFAHDRVEGVCRDMIHHLVNDIVVSGARPLAVLDVVVCGGFDGRTMLRIVGTIVRACRAQECELVGGETSVQPGVLPRDRYILSASIVGVVERRGILGRDRVRRGDVLIALASTGPHTNGFTLLRRLLVERPALARRRAGRTSFLDAILATHRCYYRPLKALLDPRTVHGLAHITGGGIADNLERILPSGLDAAIDLSRIRVPEVFSIIREAGAVEDAEMLRVFNLGVGMVAAVPPSRVSHVLGHFARARLPAYPVGRVTAGTGRVNLAGAVRYRV
jgi:phosphoribosylformylglycinamidine cyclo-ligase